MALKDQIAGKAQDVRFVDLSEKTRTSKQVREGYEVPAASINKQRAEFTLEQLPSAPRPSIPRVVTQSIAPGTHVSPGTVVDLVLAPKQSLPFGIFEKGHADLQNRTIDFLDDVIEKADVRQLVLGVDAPDKLTDSQKQVIQTEMARKQITVNPADADRSFDAMFDSLRTAAAFR